MFDMTNHKKTSYHEAEYALTNNKRFDETFNMIDETKFAIDETNYDSTDEIFNEIDETTNVLMDADNNEIAIKPTVPRQTGDPRHSLKGARTLLTRLPTSTTKPLLGS